jgi:hypothetical protein
MAKSEPGNELATKAAKLLDELWSAASSSNAPAGELDPPVRAAIEAVVNAQTKTYRYVLPTQLLAKFADPSLDCRSVQDKDKSRGSFDARSLCAKVVAPFDRDHHDVLGGTADPYVNNPLRIPRIDRSALAAQKNKAEFQHIIDVLDLAEKQPELIRPMLLAVFQAIHRRLSRAQIAYGVPTRNSFEGTTRLISRFLEDRSGGVRLQCVALALFRAIGHQFSLFASVESRKVNAADAASGDVADLACRDETATIVLAVEVKDRELVLNDIVAKLATLRANNVSEMLFLVRHDSVAKDRTADQRVASEFAGGQNIYRVNFDRFLDAILPLFGETGRHAFLSHVGEALDELAELNHREAWRDLLLSPTE